MENEEVKTEVVEGVAEQPAEEVTPATPVEEVSVEGIFKVKVKRVNTLIVKGKKKSQNTRQGRSVGRTSDYKKAIVWLTESSKPIEFFESLN